MIGTFKWVTVLAYVTVGIQAQAQAQAQLITADKGMAQGTGGSSWWYSNIKRQGIVAYSTNKTYIITRNVKDWGAKGDGVTDDTAAINRALYEGNRCKGQLATPIPCESSTTLPAIVYFPPGTYMMSSPAIMWYNTIMLGDGINMPTIKALPKFSGIALFDSNPYYYGDKTWWQNQNNFWRQVRNFIFDMTLMPMSVGVAGVHWQVAQATSLQNLVFNMKSGGGANNKQQGIYMENGSGGFMRDLVFNGGGTGFILGNQQFTASNLTFNNCQTAVFMIWDFLWAFRNMKINNCPIGISVTTENDPKFGGVVISDVVFTNVDTAIITTYNCTSKFPAAGSMTLTHVDFTGAKIAIANPNGTVFLKGGSMVDGWQQGVTMSARYGQQNFPKHDNVTCWVPQVDAVCSQGPMQPAPVPLTLKDPATGNVVDKGKPVYDNYPLSSFVSAKDNGCKGDGKTDDSDCLQNLFNNATPDQVIFLDHGAYVVTKQIFVPARRRIYGEGWALIMVKSTNLWTDMTNPTPVFVVGNKGDVGWLEMQDIVFESMGPIPGAIMMEWNLAEDAQASAGMWDVHWRIGGTTGTQLTVVECKKTPQVKASENLNPNCIAAFLLLHITSSASLYMENNWGWVADHELDNQDHDQISIYNGRGLLVESVLPVWIIGGSFEHSMLYNYQVANAKNLYMSHIQSEVAYMQENPNALIPFPPLASWNDPTFSTCFASNCPKTWGLRIYKSSFIFVYGAGLYSFFINNDASCLLTTTCSESAMSVEQSAAIYVYDVFTIGTYNLVSVDDTKLAQYGQYSSWFGSSLALFEYV